MLFMKKIKSIFSEKQRERDKSKIIFHTSGLPNLKSINECGLLQMEFIERDCMRRA